MSLATDVAALAAKDIRIELRTRQASGAAAALGAIALVLVGLAVGPDADRLRQLAPSVIWIALLFATVTVADRFERIDRADDAFSALWLVAADRRAIYLAKVVSLTLVLGLLQLGLWLLAVALLDLSLRIELLALLPIVWLTAWSTASVGALALALVSAAAHRMLLLPVLLLPLLVPTLVAGVGASVAVLDGRIADAGGWGTILSIEAALFCGLGILLYEAAAAPE